MVSVGTSWWGGLSAPLWWVISGRSAGAPVWWVITWRCSDCCGVLIIHLQQIYNTKQRKVTRLSNMIRIFFIPLVLFNGTSTKFTNDTVLDHVTISKCNPTITHQSQVPERPTQRHASCRPCRRWSREDGTWPPVDAVVYWRQDWWRVVLVTPANQAQFPPLNTHLTTYTELITIITLRSRDDWYWQLTDHKCGHYTRIVGAHRNVPLSTCILVQ